MSEARSDRSDTGAIHEMSDEELDRYVLARLAMAGVDISVLPEEDPEAPADRVRILRSARSFLRETVPELNALRIEPGELPPELYPAALFPLISSSSDEPTSR